MLGSATAFGSQIRAADSILSHTAECSRPRFNLWSLQDAGRAVLSRSMRGRNSKRPASFHWCSQSALSHPGTQPPQHHSGLYLAGPADSFGLKVVHRTWPFEPEIAQKPTCALKFRRLFRQRSPTESVGLSRRRIAELLGWTPRLVAVEKPCVEKRPPSECGE